MNYVPTLLTIFILALVIGYYFDYRQNMKIYKGKGQGVLYIVIIAIISLLLIVGGIMRFS